MRIGSGTRAISVQQLMLQLMLDLICCDFVEETPRHVLRFLERAGEVLRTRPAQPLVVARLNMRTGQKADHRHAGGSARFNSRRAVLNDDAACRNNTHPMGGMEEDVGMRFAARD